LADIEASNAGGNGACTAVEALTRQTEVCPAGDFLPPFERRNAAPARLRSTSGGRDEAKMAVRLLNSSSAAL
jgi:hypothetical protein